ncbi:MAG: DUF1580 domain-containing protein [Planctomycetes bacterium]|nr:DUF1580 domain-containing protein [Planctomycetota bacterium]
MNATDCTIGRLLAEEPLSLNDAGRMLGKHSATLWRWSLRGVRGVRLETFRVGRELRTTRQALLRFLARLSEGRPAPEPRPTDARVRRRVVAVDATLRRAGVR